MAGARDIPVPFLPFLPVHTEEIFVDDPLALPQYYAMNTLGLEKSRKKINIKYNTRDFIWVFWLSDISLIYTLRG
jgi:hypothetical protein